MDIGVKYSRPGYNNVSVIAVNCGRETCKNTNSNDGKKGMRNVIDGIIEMFSAQKRRKRKEKGKKKAKKQETKPLASS